MHSVTRLTCTFWVTKSVWADSAGVRGRHRNFRKWNFSYFIPSMLSQKLRTRNYAHFELFWLSWALYLAFFDKIRWLFFQLHWKRWRSLIWQKKFVKQQQTTNQIPRKLFARKIGNVCWILDTFHKNLCIWSLERPYKGLRRHLKMPTCA